MEKKKYPKIAPDFGLSSRRINLMKILSQVTDLQELFSDLKDLTPAEIPDRFKRLFAL